MFYLAKIPLVIRRVQVIALSSHAFLEVHSVIGSPRLLVGTHKNITQYLYFCKFY